MSKIDKDFGRLKKKTLAFKLCTFTLSEHLSSWELHGCFFLSSVTVYFGTFSPIPGKCQRGCIFFVHERAFTGIVLGTERHAGNLPAPPRFCGPIHTNVRPERKSCALTRREKHSARHLLTGSVGGKFPANLTL